MDTRRLQFILLGASKSGKSSVVERWVRPSTTPDPYETIGINLLSCAVHSADALYTTMFWDTSGRECYDTLLKSYLFNADCAIIVFDVTSTSSWKKVEFWLEQVETTNSVKFPVVIVGNKIDLESKRVVYKKDVKTFISTHAMRNVVYCECSALKNDGVLDTYHMAVNFAKMPSHETVYTAKSFRKTDGCVIV